MLNLLWILHANNNVSLLKQIEEKHAVVAGCLHYTMTFSRKRLNELVHTTAGVFECLSGVTTFCRISCYERILAYVNTNVGHNVI